MSGNETTSTGLREQVLGGSIHVSMDRGNAETSKTRETISR